MSHVAFGLRADHADSFGGAVLCVGPNGESLDTLDALQKGDGVIVVPESDTWTLLALDSHPQFKRIAVPDEPAPEEIAVDRFDAMTLTQLRDEADRLGVPHPGRSKDEVLAAVRAASTPDQEA